MSTHHGVEPADDLIDDDPHQQLSAYRGKWVALAPSFRFLGFGETAARRTPPARLRARQSP
jgi:hypothetical protein